MEYPGEPYALAAAAARRHLDALAARAMTEQRFAELAALFAKASRLEADFWQMALDSGARGPLAGKHLISGSAEKEPI